MNLKHATFRVDAPGRTQLGVYTLPVDDARLARDVRRHEGADLVTVSFLVGPEVGEVPEPTAYATRVTAAAIVEALLGDLTGRRGLRQEWDEIDHEIQDEIRGEWIRLVEERLR